jgi:hypothetical protein
LVETFEKIKDNVFYRYGSTGCAEAIRSIVKKVNYFPVYFVDNIGKFNAVDEYVAILSFAMTHSQCVLFLCVSRLYIGTVWDDYQASRKENLPFKVLIHFDYD